MAHSKIWLNDVELREKIPSAIINRVIVSPVDIQPQYQNKLFSGRMLMNARRVSIGVTLQVQFRNSKDPVIRAEAVDALNAWAAPGGWLRLSNRPGKRLKVNAVKLASEETMHKYGEIAEIKFSADEVPYWESITPVIAVSSSSEPTFGIMYMYPRNTAETPVEMVITVTSGLLTSLNLSASNERGTDMRSLFFENLTVEQGGTITIKYIGGDIMVITGPDGYIPDATLNSKLSAGSSDLLVVPGGETIAVTYSSDAPVQVTARIYGRWL